MNDLRIALVPMGHQIMTYLVRYHNDDRGRFVLGHLPNPCKLMNLYINPESCHFHTVDSADEDLFIETYKTDGPRGLSILLENLGLVHSLQ
jgi:hypothetical protein